MQDVNEAVRSYIVEEFADEGFDLGELHDGTNLIEDEVLDSLGIMALVGFLEERFEISIDPAEVEIDNFETLSAITHLVTSKLEAAGRRG
jgi:acyl carrier protein